MMYLKDTEFISQYNEDMAQIKHQNRIDIMDKQLVDLSLYIAQQKTGLVNYSRNYMDILMHMERDPFPPVPNYFADEKLVVYTVIFGPYDKLIEPLTIPDNCEFYVITNQEVDLSNSAWQAYKVNLADFGLEDKTNTIKNRFFKMHPHLLFKDEKYSLYIDGNIKVMTDPTEFLNNLNDFGAMFHHHYRVECAYTEIERCRSWGLDSDQAFDQVIEFFEATNFPHNYGLLECPVILREHHKAEVIDLMEDWWQHFMRFAKRDQITLPYLLWKRGIQVWDLSGLGKDFYANYAFRKVPHQQTYTEALAYHQKGDK